MTDATLADKAQFFINSFSNDQILELKDKDKKKEWLATGKADLGGEGRSAEATLNGKLRNRLKSMDIDPDEFTGKSAKKFSAKLDIKSEVKPVDKQEFSIMSNKAKSKTDGKTTEMSTVPLESAVGILDRGVGAFFNKDDYPEMSKQEREDMAACLHYIIGDRLNDHEKIRMALGFVGLFGFFGRRIKNARDAGKERKEKDNVKLESGESIPKTLLKPIPEATKAEKEKLEQQAKQFQEETDI